MMLDLTEARAIACGSQTALDGPSIVLSRYSGLAALAQESRLDVFRLLVQAGTDGLPAGHIGERLGLPSATVVMDFSPEGRRIRPFGTAVNNVAVLILHHAGCAGCGSGRGQPHRHGHIVAIGTSEVIERQRLRMIE